MLKKFETEYPNSIDKKMYKMYYHELKKKKKKLKIYQKKKEIEEIKLLNKKRKIEFFTETELKDIYYDKLKIHLYINVIKRNVKQDNDVIVDLSSNTTSHSEDIIIINQDEKENKQNN